MYQRILVPVDGSPTSAQSLGEALRLARMSGGQVRLLHLVDTLSLALTLGAYGAFSGDIADDLRKEGEKILQHCHQQALDAGVTADRVMEEGTRGRLAELVQEQVKSWPADLVVLGSDAEQVVRSCPVPVLLVRGTDALPLG